MQNANLDTIMQRKGQIATFVTERPMKVRKGMAPITKRSEFQARVGVNYDNIKRVQDKRDAGVLPEENAGLPWGTWHVFPYVIEHKGEYYVRCTVVRNDFRRAATYMQNGEEITREAAQAQCLASEFAERGDDTEVFNIKVSSIREVR
jgi:hypothetical protein